METGKPDQIGEVGEKALFSLSEHRPEGSQWWLFPLIVVNSFLSAQVREVLQNDFGVLKSEANLAAGTITVGTFLAIFQIEAIARNKRRIIDSLKITRGYEIIETDSARTEVLAVPDKGDRQLRFTLILVGVGLCASFVFYNFSPLVNLIYGSLSLIGLFYLCAFLWEISRPILVVDSQGLKTRRKNIPWSSVHLVQIQHLKNVFGSFTAIKLTLFSVSNEVLTQVTIPGKSLTVSQEKNLLISVSKFLGRMPIRVVEGAYSWI